MEERKFTCIVCPNSCELAVRGGEVSGHKCKRGKEFALQELAAPQRVLTTTVSYSSGGKRGVAPVKTVTPVPLSDIRKILSVIKNIVLTEQPAPGAVIPISFNNKQVDIVITG